MVRRVRLVGRCSVLNGVEFFRRMRIWIIRRGLEINIFLGIFKRVM